MGQRSQTETAVLGALSVEPMSGYALRNAIQEVLGHFWSESFGQIYPTLKRLQEEGLVERSSGHESLFVVTPAGLERLGARLSESIQDAPPRNGLMLRLFFGRHLGPAACRELIEHARSDAEARLADFAAIRREIAADRHAAADQPFFLLTVSAGEHAARATIAWADEALDTIDTIDTTTGES
jgi:DNA-binding PadR family transcriptional regulator